MTRPNGRVTRGPHSIMAVALAGALLAGCGSSGKGAVTTAASTPAPPPWEIKGAYTASIDPANFVTTIDNPYFPLVPGTAFHYRGTKEGTKQTDDMVVTDQTKQILGVTATVVEDTVSENGTAVERTFDWYAQDKQGNVWYMGEDSLELKHGKLVGASDSWESGVKGALPGIIMPGNPQPGAVYRQEYYPAGGALDQARSFEPTRARGFPPARSSRWSPPRSSARWSHSSRRSTTPAASVRSRRRWSQEATSASTWSA
ncbi:MAG TPA: hypothetical protein VFQ15_02965 [Jiangellaceae bacterium]|nr:hypothetical protein [Jiangellaceae bacterium]